MTCTRGHFTYKQNHIDYSYMLFPAMCGVLLIFDLQTSWELQEAEEDEKDDTLIAFSKHLLSQNRSNNNNTWHRAKLVIADAIGGENGEKSISLWRMTQLDKRWRKCGREVYNNNSGNQVRMWEYNRVLSGSIY